MAVSGHNGNNETLVGLSSSIGLTVYDEKVNEIQVKNSILNRNVKHFKHVLKNKYKLF